VPRFDRVEPFVTPATMPMRAHTLINRSRSIVAGSKGVNRFVATSDAGRAKFTIIGEARKRRVVIVTMWKQKR